MPFFVGDALLAHANAGCYRCGRGDHLIDMDVQIVGEGALALCRKCVGEAAEAAKIYTNQARVAELEAEALLLRSEVQRAQEREARFEAALAAVHEEVALLAPAAPAPCTALTKAGAPCKGTAFEGDTCPVHTPAGGHLVTDNQP